MLGLSFRFIKAAAIEMSAIALCGACGASGNWSATAPGDAGQQPITDSGPISMSDAETSVMHVVGKCDHLAAVGQWENVTPAGVTLMPPYEGVINVIADPVRTGTVYGTTYNSGIFKSLDCGATWAKINTGRNASQIDAGRIWSAAIDPKAPDTLYALTGYGPSGLWKTTNGGVDWDQVGPTLAGLPGFVGRIAMDPANSAHLMLSFHDNCSAGHAPVCFAETKDGAMSWTAFDFPSSLASQWGEGAGLMILGNKLLYANWGLFYSPDSGATWSQVQAGPADDVTLFQTPDSKYYLGYQNGVLTSTDGATWTPVANSGQYIQKVIGGGNTLFAIVGFQAPAAGMPFMYSASYSDPMNFTMMATPGLPANLPSGGTDMSYDADHHVLYSAIQAAGLYRVVTQ